MTRLFRVLLLMAVVGVGASESIALQGGFQDELANLRSPNTGTREKAAKSLGRSARPEAITPLNEAMRDPEAKVRREVAKSLRVYRNPATLDGLLMGLRDEDRNVRTESLLGVVEVYVDPDDRRPMERFLGAFSERQPRPPAEPVIPVEERVVLGLEARLQDEESSIRRQAAWALGLLSVDEAVDSLGMALADPSKDVRMEALRALAHIGTDEAGSQLVTVLMEPSRRMQGEAIDALGEVGYKPAAPQLLSIYDAEQGREMGDRALTALARIGAPEARGVFLQNMTSSDPLRRRWAVEGMGRLRDENLAGSLTKDFLREPEPSVQSAYCFALALVGRPEFIDRIALSLADQFLREQSVAYLVELGSPFLTELVPYLSDPVVDVRRGMALALERVGDPDAIPYLRPLLADPDPRVADWANRAIASLERVRMSETDHSSP